MDYRVSDLVEAVMRDCKEDGEVNVEKATALLSDLSHEISILTQKIEAFQMVGAAIEEFDGAMDVVIIPHEPESEERAAFSEFIKEFGFSLIDEEGGDVTDADLDQLINAYVDANTK